MSPIVAALAAFVSGLAFGCTWGCWRLSKLHAQHALRWHASADRSERLALRATHIADQVEAAIASIEN